MAHTLDLTHVSARLGGLLTPLAPDEIIEVQRGGNKAKFRVIWMGAPGGPMQGQAGIRSLEPYKKIWGEDIPHDDTDAPVNVEERRRPMPPVRTRSGRTDEKRWDPRYECQGVASVKAGSTAFALWGQVKDISVRGVYIEVSTPLPVKTLVYVSASIESIGMEAAGIVRTSYPLLGMGLEFQRLNTENREKLCAIIEGIKRRSSKFCSEPAQELSGMPQEPAPATDASTQTLSLEVYPASVLAQACRALAGNASRWKESRTQAEIKEVQSAIEQLQQNLVPSSTTTIDLVDYFGTPKAWNNV